jgi:hypothetical protein
MITWLWKNMTNITVFLTSETDIFCAFAVGEHHSMLCLLVWGSYWKEQVSSPITVWSSREQSLSTH